MKKFLIILIIFILSVSTFGSSLYEQGKWMGYAVGVQMYEVWLKNHRYTKTSAQFFIELSVTMEKVDRLVLKTYGAFQKGVALGYVQRGANMKYKYDRKIFPKYIEIFIKALNLVAEYARSGIH